MEKLDLKKGDMVIFRGKYTTAITKIDRVTKTMFVTKYGKFNKQGRLIGATVWNATYIGKGSEEEIKKIKDQMIYNKKINFLTNIKWKDYSVDKLDQIIKMLHV